LKRWEKYLIKKKEAKANQSFTRISPDIFDNHHDSTEQLHREALSQGNKPVSILWRSKTPMRSITTAKNFFKENSNRASS